MAEAEQVLKQTVQSFPNTEGVQPFPHGGLIIRYGAWEEFIPAWGSQWIKRDKTLRALFYRMDNTLFQGALNVVINRFSGFNWDVKGGRNNARYFQELLQEAEFGLGWDVFLSRVLTDWATQDAGAYIEIVGPGDPAREITGRVTGIAHLDAAMCWPTGDPLYPVAFRNPMDGVFRLMHHTRVFRLVDNPSPVWEAFGRGFCALSRYVGIGMRQTLMGRYMREALGNTLPAGIMTVTGVNEKQFQDALQKYEESQRRGEDGRERLYKDIVRLQSVDPNNPVKVELLPFSSLPDRVDPDTAYPTDATLAALAFGLDPQDVWPLSSGQFGTGTQSRVLADKAEGKTLASLLNQLTRFFNQHVLSPSEEFAFRIKRGQVSRQEAETAAVWAAGLQTLGGMTTEQRFRLMANVSEAYADVLIDDDGSVRMPDDDILAQGQEDYEVTDLESSEPDGETPTGAGIGRPTVGVGAGVDRREHRGLAVVAKSYQSDRLEFESRVADTIADALRGNLTPARFAIVMRAHLSRSGRQALLEGLRRGGVDVDVLDEDEQAALTEWLAEQETYVQNLRSEIYTERRQMDPVYRAHLWANKSLDPAYQLGLLHADANQLEEWVLGRTEKHCRDCLRLNGQRHRRKHWHAKGLLPGSSNLECKGFNCGCKLVAVRGKARGNF